MRSSCIVYVSIYIRVNISTPTCSLFYSLTELIVIVPSARQARSTAFSITIAIGDRTEGPSSYTKKKEAAASRRQRNVFVPQRV